MTLWSQHSSNQVIVQHSSDIVTCSDTRDVQVTPDICPQTPGHMPCVITCLTFIRPRVFSINSPSQSHHIDKWFDLTEFQTLAALAMAPQSSLPQFSPLEVSAPSKVRDVRGQWRVLNWIDWNNVWVHPPRFEYVFGRFGPETFSSRGSSCPTLNGGFCISLIFPGDLTRGARCGVREDSRGRRPGPQD